jgi:hypothetical protein
VDACHALGVLMSEIFERRYDRRALESKGGAAARERGTGPFLERGETRRYRVE